MLDKAADAVEKNVKVVDKAIPVVEKCANMILNVAEKAVDTGVNIIDKITDIPFKIINKFKNGNSTSDNLKSELNVAIKTIKDVEIKQNVINNSQNLRIGKLEKNYNNFGNAIIFQGSRINKMAGLIGEQGVRIGRLEGVSAKTAYSDF